MAFIVSIDSKQWLVNFKQSDEYWTWCLIQTWYCVSSNNTPSWVYTANSALRKWNAHVVNVPAVGYCVYFNTERDFIIFVLRWG